MIICRHSAEYPSHYGFQYRRPRKCTKIKIIRTYAMIRTNSCQMISISSRSTARHLEMMNACFWLKDDMITGGTPTIGEFCFKSISYANKIFIKTANCDRSASVEREISPHKLIDFT